MVFLPQTLHLNMGLYCEVNREPLIRSLAAKEMPKITDSKFNLIIQGYFPISCLHPPNSVYQVSFTLFLTETVTLKLQWYFTVGVCGVSAAV